ncbi:MAG TPA: hypothetical protein VGO18_21010 [Steroidobacteraceae bacterium]|jgi:hypothetical protein|nr:hypothetical protein [Steroidobacteraceae bacterium]
MPDQSEALMDQEEQCSDGATWHRVMCSWCAMKGELFAAAAANWLAVPKNRRLPAALEPSADAA